jgi:hypothetical protein
MKLRDESLFESYMQYEKRIRNFANTWVDCIEVGLNGGMPIDMAIATTHKLITFGTELTLAALELIILCWEHGEEMAEWYDNISLLVNI